MIGHLYILLVMFHNLFKDPNFYPVKNILALHGLSKIVKILLNLANYPRDETDCCGSTPFMDSVRSGNLDTVKILYEYHKVCFILIYQLNAIFFLIFRWKKCDFQKSDKSGRQPIHLAAEIGNLEIFSFLVDILHVEIGSETTNLSNKMTSAHFAAKVLKKIVFLTENYNFSLISNCKEGHLTILRKISEMDRSCLVIKDFQGRFPIDYAKMSNFVDCVEFLEKFLENV